MYVSLIVHYFVCHNFFLNRSWNTAIDCLICLKYCSQECIELLSLGFLIDHARRALFYKKKKQYNIRNTQAHIKMRKFTWHLHIMIRLRFIDLFFWYFVIVRYITATPPLDTVYIISFACAITTSAFYRYVIVCTRAVNQNWVGR